MAYTNTYHRRSEELFDAATATGSPMDELRSITGGLSQILDSPNEDDASQWTLDILESTQSNLDHFLEKLQDQIYDASRLLDEAGYDVDDLQEEVEEARQMAPQPTMAAMLHELDGRMMTEDDSVTLQWVRDSLRKLSNESTDDADTFNRILKGVLR